MVGVGGRTIKCSLVHIGVHEGMAYDVEIYSHMFVGMLTEDG